MKKKIILVGGGGHCCSCIDVIEMESKYEIAGIIDTPENIGKEVLGYNIIGSDDDIPELCKQGANFIISIGHLGNYEIRDRLYRIIKSLGGRLPIVISPMAYVSKYAKVGEGTIVMHQALVNAKAVIGYNCIINTGALIEHEVKIGNNCHISTQAIVNGRAEVGSGSFIGSNAICVQGISVARNSFIRANTLIKSNRP